MGIVSYTASDAIYGICFLEAIHQQVSCCEVQHLQSGSFYPHDVPKIRIIVYCINIYLVLLGILMLQWEVVPQNARNLFVAQLIQDIQVKALSLSHSR